MAHPVEPGSAALSDARLRPRYLERPVPLVFPESADVPESQLHLDLRTLLYLLLSDYLGETHTVGSDQFVYWDASDPKRCIAPDVYVQCSPPGERVRVWKVWERGAPDVAVEIVSESDAPAAEWSSKLCSYQSLGVSEVVRLDLLTDAAPSLRVWNRVDGVLSERVVDNQVAPSLVLDLDWVLAPVPLAGSPRPLALALRIAKPGSPESLIPTPFEARQAEALARQAETARADAEAGARKAAEARIAELEALLKSRQ